MFSFLDEKTRALAPRARTLDPMVLLPDPFLRGNLLAQWVGACLGSNVGSLFRLLVSDPLWDSPEPCVA